uniref:Uncharacterized protein n=1 Tax=Anopheles dirus TaxID=7168 RepID=A0A182NIF3_9DIPT
MPVALRNQLLEHLREVGRHLPERELDRLDLARLQQLHQLADLVLADVQLRLALVQLLLLLGEAEELIERLLVHVVVLLQVLVRLLQLLEQRLQRHLLVGGVHVRQRPEARDLLRALVDLLVQHVLLRGPLLHPLSVLLQLLLRFLLLLDPRLELLLERLLQFHRLA